MIKMQDELYCILLLVFLFVAKRSLLAGWSVAALGRLGECSKGEALLVGKRFFFPRTLLRIVQLRPQTHDNIRIFRADTRIKVGGCKEALS